MTNEIQWYPGHIAKAERDLKDQLKLVDAVIEVRDARIPLATNHPRVPLWVGNKQRVLVINRLDSIDPVARRAWETWFLQQSETPYFTNAQDGTGVRQVAAAAKAAAIAVNQRRRDRGMLPRPARAAVIGFPNVGKSALINRLLGRRVVESARRPGVTRQLRWVRISKELELLDAPGVIPAQLDDRLAALKLAICDDIGSAAYHNHIVAAALLDLLVNLDRSSSLVSRYQLEPESMSGEQYLYALAQQRHQGDEERTARELLNDFRTGNLGHICLEMPPV
ncbi:MAG: ribosome biogenesis GTPase YlqF [Oscillatoriaceae cyanobacterium]